MGLPQRGILLASMAAFWFAGMGTVLPAQAQDATAVWNAIEQAPFGTSKAAHVENVTIVHDRIRITLVGGTIAFAKPAAGVVFGAAFEGRGSIAIVPPNPLEAQQLELFTKQTTLEMNFTEATFSFTDDTYAQVAKQVKWTNVPVTDLRRLYQNRQTERENNEGASLVPRIFEGVVSSDHQATAYFAAELKTADKGWVLARYDAFDPEEIRVGRYVYGGSRQQIFNTWMSFPAGNLTSSQAYRNPLEKDPFLVKAYKIDATVTAGAELSSTTRVALQYQISGERAVDFELNANLRVTSVQDGKGQGLEFFQPKEPKDRYPTYGDYVVVALPQPSRSGQQASLVFAYAGKRVIRKVGSGNYFCPSYGWYPGVSDDFAARSDFQMTFHTPKKLTLVATGDKTGEVRGKVWDVTHWTSPMPQAVAGFAFGSFKVYDEKVGKIRVEVYAGKNPDDFLNSINQAINTELPGTEEQSAVMPAIGTLDPAAMLKTIGKEISNNLRLFQIFYGPYPFDHLAVTTIPYSYGQGWPMLLYLSEISFLDQTQRHALGVQDQVGISDYFRAHEVSHQWWGHEVGWKSYHDQWLSEGFAQFSGELYVEFRDGLKEYRNRLKLDREALGNRNRYGYRYEDLGAVWMGDRLSSSLAPGGYKVVVYDKGGYVLEMLRAMLYNPTSKTPDAAFQAMMQDFTKTYHDKPASTEDFKAIVERHMLPPMNLDGNHRMDWFFKQYVYGTGMAQYRFDYTTKESPAGKWVVRATITQTGVPAGWRDLLPVYVHFKGRDIRVGMARIRKPVTRLQFALPIRPDKVSLNDGEEILAEIK